MKTDVYEREATTTTRPRGEDKSRSLKPEADQDEIMKKVEAAGTPGPAHQALDVLEGDWKAEVKCWMDADGSPEVTQGTAIGKWTLNGRFLEEEFHGEMMGKPFSGRLLLGFDNTKQTFNSVWLSDNQTSMFASEGKGDSGNKVITLEGKSSCPATGRKDVPMKTVWRLISPDKHVLEMYDGSRGTRRRWKLPTRGSKVSGSCKHSGPRGPLCMRLEEERSLNRSSRIFARIAPCCAVGL